MNVSTIAVPRETAIQKINDIEALKKSQRTDEDDALLSVFKAVRKHDARVINIADAFRQTGLNEKAQPKLGIAQAHWPTVNYDPDADMRSGEFFQLAANTSWRKSQSGLIRLPNQIFDQPIGTYRRNRLRSAVPHIPANIRPKFKLSNYHILFEVKEWTEYPVDPFLLKRVTGNLFIVLAEWELTELEASLLGSMRAN